MKISAPQNPPQFPAKLLLFGEYAILQGGDALALPLKNFTGGFCIDRQNKWDELHIRLLEILKKYLSIAHRSNPKVNRIAEAFTDDLMKGLRLSTNIPVGYGLGSSGVLTAAMYYRYIQDHEQDPAKLQAELGGIESIFHGRSSGLDPLVSYTGKAVQVSNGTTVILSPMKTSMVCQLLLADTQQARSTATMMAVFRDLCKDQIFMSVLHNQLIPLQNTAVRAWLDRRSEHVFSLVKQISALQWRYMQAMIPESAHELWRRCLDPGYPLAVKILGAGGGGYMLLMHRHPQNGIQNQNLPVFQQDQLGGLPIIRLD